MEVDSEISCQLECVDEEGCHSYNFGTIKDDSERFKYQLSDSDRFAGFANFTKDKNFIYRGMMVLLRNFPFRKKRKSFPRR
ncbi:hypothetical protein AWC38_SpisGene24986 [Stylophora pistillata]|uniref:Apple domain-containing protein n=1 Tax=Stylophora pistillata TaxID=50429 RepID=A0A2B4R3F5_STYPI|nr:hypothetical protein AWC38_SpisGene24986 [Stylophora pistillata]